MRIREAEDKDVEAVCRLLEAAFCRPDEARLYAALWASDELAVALLSEADDGPAGIAVLSHLAAPQGALGLGPLAVARERRDRGIGKALIGACVDWARNAGHGAIFVLGQPPHYARFGFSVEAARPFESPYPPEFMMALELRKGALASALQDGAEIRYPPVFAAL